jgi:hypothetical protein
MQQQQEKQVDKPFQLVEKQLIGALHSDIAELRRFKK